MIECFVCHCEVSDTLPDYFMHLKLQHGRSGQYDTYCCSQGQCCRTFSNKYTFTQHLRKHHQDEFSHQRHSVLAVEEAACNADNYSCSMETENDTDVCDRDNCAGVMPEHNSTSKDIKQLAAAFIAELKGCISTLSTVNRVVISCRQLFESMVDDIAVTLDSAGVTCDEVGSKLDIYRNPFANLETEYAQTTYMESIGAFVRPETYIVGNRQTFQVDNTANLKKPVMENVTAQYVPLTKMIVALNDKTNLIRCALQGVTENDGCFRSYFDGSVWNDLALTNQPILVLRLYGDDFEPCNPLGSRKTVYKIGCIYYQIENLPSYLLSKTENIFLATCYHSDDVKYFGWEAILRPLVNELKALETTGITLVVNGETMQVKVIVGVFTADNLFMNSIMGFVEESFTANKPCRECTLHRHDFQKVFVEDKNLVRTVESYDYAVETVNVQETGIKQKCVLNELKFFHVANNCSHDVMHDVFEGVLSYDTLLILTALIEAGYFTLEVFNHRVQTFSYGYHDAGSKPPTIFLPAEMLPFDASQTFCLMRIMALAVGDLVPEDDAIWQFYLTLRQIMDIVLSPSISEMQVQALSVLVSEYLECHLTLFPCHTLKNKHHHLIHFPSLIRKIGPLIRYSCMRFESKHQRSKKLLHIAGNFKNALKSCAFRHQHDVAFRLLKASTEEGFDIVIGNGSVVTISELQDGVGINHCLGNVGMYCEFYAAKWVEVHGIKYKPSVVIHCGTEHENTPVFLEVQHILVRQSSGSSPNIWFVGQKLNTLYFNSHFHSWCVERPIPHEIASFDPTTLLYCTPLTVSRQVYHGDRVELVSVRYHV